MCVCGVGSWGLDGGWTPLPARPQRYCDPASLVSPWVYIKRFQLHVRFWTVSIAQWIPSRLRAFLMHSAHTDDAWCQGWNILNLNKQKDALFDIIINFFRNTSPWDISSRLTTNLSVYATGLSLRIDFVTIFPIVTKTGMNTPSIYSSRTHTLRLQLYRKEMDRCIDCDRCQFRSKKCSSAPGVLVETARVC